MPTIPRACPTRRINRAFIRKVHDWCSQVVILDTKRILNFNLQISISPKDMLYQLFVNNVTPVWRIYEILTWEAVENTVESARLKITSLSLDFVNKFILSMWMVTWIALNRSNFISHLSERLWISLIERKKICKIECHKCQSKHSKFVAPLQTGYFFHRSTCTIEQLEEVYIFLGATVMRGTMRVFIKSVKYARSDDKYTLCTLR